MHRIIRFCLQTLGICRCSLLNVCSFFKENIFRVSFRLQRKSVHSSYRFVSPVHLPRRCLAPQRSSAVSVATKPQVAAEFQLVAPQVGTGTAVFLFLQSFFQLYNYFHVFILYFCIFCCFLIVFFVFLAWHGGRKHSKQRQSSTWNQLL